MALPTDAVGSVKQLGIDDFALRRGRNYGTVLVDLVRHRVIDLLPDRKAEPAKVWMQSHPEIDLVSRDRGGDYASAPGNSERVLQRFPECFAEVLGTNMLLR